MKKKQEAELYYAWRNTTGISQDDFLKTYSQKWNINTKRLKEALIWVHKHGALDFVDLAMSLYNHPDINESLATKTINNLLRVRMYTKNDILEFYKSDNKKCLMDYVANMGPKTENVIRDICNLKLLEPAKPQPGEKVYLLSAFDPIANVGAVAVYKNQSYAVNALEKYRSDNPDSSVEILELRMNELREIGFLEWEGV